MRPGATVAVAAPAGPVHADRIAAGLELLRQRYDVRVADDLFAAEGYLAGSDERRARELNGYLRDPDVRAVFVARGGYGILRILERLDAAALGGDPKPIVGFSDATALLSWAAVAAGVRAVHGPVVTQLGALPGEDVASLFDLLETGAVAAPFAESLEVAGLGEAGAVEGPVVGGNLALLSHMLGTPFAMPTDGAVLVLEDIGERPYQIDRYLTHLQLAGALDGVAGVALGDFARCDEPPGPRPVPDVFAVLQERLEAAGVRWARGVPVGHGARNRAFFFGAPGRIEAGRLDVSRLA